MATPVEALSRRSGRQKPPSTPATTPKSAMCSSFLNQVLLHDWWLIKADSDSNDKQLGIGGFTIKDNARDQRLRCFSSAPIVKRHDAVTLKTVDGVTIMVHGYLNRSLTLKNGFSQEVCDHFLIGFPYNWEEFAALSVSEEPADFSAPNGVSCSDACKAPARGNHGTNRLSGYIFGATLNEASSVKKESSLPIQSTVSDACQAPAPGDLGTNVLSGDIFDATLNEASSAKKESSLPIQSTVSDACKTPAPGDHGTNLPSGDIFDATLNEASTANKESSLPIQSAVSVKDKKIKADKKRRGSSNVEHVKHGGPLTRSRARLLDN